MIAANALYILILVMGDGDLKYIQDLNQQTCYALRDISISASNAVVPGSPKQVQYAICINTQDPLGTP